MARQFSLFPLLLGLMAIFIIDGAHVQIVEGHQMEDHFAQKRITQQTKVDYKQSFKAYRIPEITLVNHEGKEVALPSLLQRSGPVALNFFFTSCTAICPVQTATFAEMYKELGPDAEGLKMVSISIDPEYDTPGILKTHAERYQAVPDWQFLTGDARQIVKVQKAFDAFTGSKMNHRPLTLFKINGNEKWLRIDGLTSGAELANEYRGLLAK